MVRDEAGAPPLIELREVRKGYGGGAAPVVEVLRGVSLTIRAGEFVAIVGSSGSGKSTLMHLIGCLDRPSSGTYRFAGRDVAAMPADELAGLRREAFGFVFQGYHLIPTCSALENVEVPAVYAGLDAAARRRRASALLTRLGLGERLDNRPSQLSGGQQQRVSIARALMNGGSLILADEPTGALDSRSGREVMALLDELSAEGHTLVLITHDRAVAARARRVVEIRDGLIVADSGAAVADERPATPPRPWSSGMTGAGWRADIGEAARSAWRGMRLNRLRTALTLLGIVIGVASVIVMFAIGLGTKQQVMSQMAALGATVMYVSGDYPPEGGRAGKLTLDDLEAVGRLAPVAEVMPVIGDPVTVRRAEVSRSVYVFASSANLPTIHHWPVAQGRFFSEADNAERAPVAVLGHKTRQHFFGERDPLGELLLVGRAPFEVIGVMAEKGADTAAADYDDMLFVPYESGRARVYKGMAHPDYAVLSAVSGAQVGAAEAAVRALLLERRGREDFSIGNAAARLAAEVKTQDSMTRLLSLIAAVSLVVGGIGVMNVMLMTVRERTREIGIRIATGARERDILRQFLTESVMVSLSGGVVGVLAGLGCGALLGLLGVPVVYSLSAILGAFACAVGVGLVFGYAPARQAARLDPVVALGGEG